MAPARCRGCAGSPGVCRPAARSPSSRRCGADSDAAPRSPAPAVPPAANCTAQCGTGRHGPVRSQRNSTCQIQVDQRHQTGRAGQDGRWPADRDTGWRRTSGRRWSRRRGERTASASASAGFAGIRSRSGTARRTDREARSRTDQFGGERARRAASGGTGRGSGRRFPAGGAVRRGTVPGRAHCS